MASPSIPNFELIRPIGEGGFGVVWLARTVTGKLRAVKWIRKDHFQQAGLSQVGAETLFRLEFQGVERFEDLAASAPELISIFLIGWTKDKEAYYYVMPLADSLGEMENLDQYRPHTLAGELEREEPLAWDEALGLITRIGRGAARLQRAGLQHGDITPANVLFLDGKATLADPGLTSLTDETIRARSPGYTDPEGVSDVYSLGRLFYHLVTGQHPMEGFPIIPAEVRAHLPVAKMATVLDRCCDPERENRFENAGEFVEFLDPGSLPPEPSGRLWKVGLMTVGLLILAGLGWILYDRFFPPPPAYAEVEEDRLSVFADKNGRLLWSKLIEGELSEAHVVDLDEDGSPEVVCVIEHLTPRAGGYVKVFSDKGEPLWEFASTPDEHNYPEYDGQGMGLYGLIIEDFDGKPGKEMMLLCRNAFNWFPTALQFLDAQGQSNATYWHPGQLWIEDIRVFTPPDSKTPQILFHGVNNRLGVPANDLPLSRRKHTSVIALIDPTRKGQHGAPPGSGALKGEDAMTVWYRKFTPQFTRVRILKTEDENDDGIPEIIVNLFSHQNVIDESEHIQCDLVIDPDGNLLKKRAGDGHRYKVGLDGVK
jgi:serine/threonine protein kinase